VSDVFCQLSREGRAEVERGMLRYQFAAGATVVEKGQAVSGAFFVLEGALRVYSLSPSGIAATLYLLKPGETCVLALNSLFNDLVYPAFVAAETDTTVAVVPGVLYRRLFIREPVIQDITVRALSVVVFRLMDELEQVHTSRLDERLSRFLLTAAAPDGRVRMTQQVIADHVGTSREVVARLMGGFVEKGWIRTGRGEVTLLPAFPRALPKAARSQPRA
jgi:CRP/FNR family transcriptional regulator, anaerobic regulatory protein